MAYVLPAFAAVRTFSAIISLYASIPSRIPSCGLVTKSIAPAQRAQRDF